MSNNAESAEEFSSRYPEIMDEVEDLLNPKKAHSNSLSKPKEQSAARIRVDTAVELECSFDAVYPELIAQIDQHLLAHFIQVAFMYERLTVDYRKLLESEKRKGEVIVRLDSLSRGQKFIYIPCSPREDTEITLVYGYKVKKRLNGKKVILIATNDPLQFLPLNQLVLIKI